MTLLSGGQTSCSPCLAVDVTEDKEKKHSGERQCRQLSRRNTRGNLCVSYERNVSTAVFLDFFFHFTPHTVHFDIEVRIG